MRELGLCSSERELNIKFNTNKVSCNLKNFTCRNFLHVKSLWLKVATVYTSVERFHRGCPKIIDFDPSVANVLQKYKLPLV